MTSSTFLIHHHYHNYHHHHHNNQQQQQKAEDFRKRIKEKESLLEKKTKALNTAQSAKRQIEQELTELKDQMDMKDRKISLLQRKAS
ncbi:unnamed protein product [Trichobilharzia regenti]|nr:unnamed protein product [Trichobilharzia regenti]